LGHSEVRGFFFFFLKEINTFIQQRWINLTKSDSKYIFNVTKYLYVKKNKNNKKNTSIRFYSSNISDIVYHGFHRNIKQHNRFQH